MAFCTQCGSQLETDARFCTVCGRAVPEEARVLVDASPSEGTPPTPPPAAADPGETTAAATDPRPGDPSTSAPPPGEAGPAALQLPSIELGPFIQTLQESWVGGLVAGLIPILVAYSLGLYGALRIREALGPDWAELSGLIPIAKLAGLLGSGVLGLPLELSSSGEILGIQIAGNATFSGSLIGLVVVAMLGPLIAARVWSGRRIASVSHCAAYLLVALAAFAIGTALLAAAASVDNLGVMLQPRPTGFLTILALALAVGLGLLPRLRRIPEDDARAPSPRMSAAIDGFAGAGWAVTFTVVAFLSFFIALAITQSQTAREAFASDTTAEPTPAVVDIVSLAAVGSAQVVATAFGPLHGGTLAATVDIAALDVGATYTTSLLDFPALDGEGLVLAPWFVLVALLVPVAGGAFGMAIAQRRSASRPSSTITMFSLAASYAAAVAATAGLASITVDGGLTIEGESLSGVFQTGPGPAASFIGALVLVTLGAFVGRALLGLSQPWLVATLAMVIGAGAVTFGVLGWSNALEDADLEQLIAGLESEGSPFGPQVGDEFDEIPSSLGAEPTDDDGAGGLFGRQEDQDFDDIASSLTGGTPWYELRVGDCFDDPTSAAELEALDTFDCSRSHHNEVYATFEIPGSSYPGTNSLSSMARQECIDRFEDFVGMDYGASAIYYGHIWPDETDWQQGRRTMVCVAFEPGVRLTGSVENARR